MICAVFCSLLLVTLCVPGTAEAAGWQTSDNSIRFNYSYTADGYIGMIVFWIVLLVLGLSGIITILYLRKQNISKNN